MEENGFCSSHGTFVDPKQSIGCQVAHHDSLADHDDGKWGGRTERVLKIDGSKMLHVGSGSRDVPSGTSAGDQDAVETRVPLLLSVSKNAANTTRVRLDALDELSSVLVSGRRDSELSTAVVTAGW